MNSKILIDTDILSYYLKGIPEVVDSFNAFKQQKGTIFVSRITIIEILGGLKIKNASKQEAQFRQFIKTQNILEIDEKIGELASEIFAYLHKVGRHSGNYDILIAATALSHQATLCSNNVKDYQNIPNLQLVNWREH